MPPKSTVMVEEQIPAPLNSEDSHGQNAYSYVIVGGGKEQTCLRTSRALFWVSTLAVVGLAVFKTEYEKVDATDSTQIVGAGAIICVKNCFFLNKQ